MPDLPGVRVLSDPDHLARAAAELFIRSAQAAIQDRGSFSVMLSGGSTPTALYRLLAEPDSAAQISWKQVHVFWGDERCVPPDHPNSNYRLAHETLLGRVPLPTHHIHRIPAERAPAEAAAHYEADLVAHLRAAAPGHLRLFDLTLLGLGEDGHTASLFPGSRALQETSRLVTADFIPSRNEWRVTLTVPALNYLSDQILFLASGADKAAALNRVLCGPFDPAALPAQAIRPLSGLVIWLVDAQAAKALPPISP